MIFFTSDQHFNHTNIIKYCNRKFNDVEEMNALLIKNWNSVVAPEDVVYIIGDFAFSDHKRFLDALNGTKHLIAGSHDMVPREIIGNELQSVQKYKELTIKNQRIILSHCPLRCWEYAQEGSIHLFGHVHGRVTTYNLSMDVGVDTHNYTPYSLEEILQYMSNKKIDMRRDGRILIRNGVEQFYQDDIRWFEHVVNTFKDNVRSVR